MSWQRRLLELAAAGGMLAACEDAPQKPDFCGNVMPDPCICDRMPADSVQCVAEAQCRANGGSWEFTDGYGSRAPDAATDVWGMCHLPGSPADAGPAGPDSSIDAPLKNSPLE